MSNCTPTITHPSSSKTVVSEIEHLGFSFQIYRRSGTRKLSYRGTIDGRRVRESTGFEDEKAAEQFVIDVIEELAERLISKKDLRTGNATLQQVWSLFERDKLPTYERAQERVKLKGAMRRVMSFWGSEKPVGDIDRHDVETYTRHRVENDGVKYDTVDLDMERLSRVLNWAKERKIDGIAVIEENPVRRKWVPADKRKPRQPLCRHHRFLRILRFARHQSRGGHRGYFLTMLILARYTGRRIGSIRHLRYRDLLLTPERVRRAIDDLVEQDIIRDDAADIYPEKAPDLWEYGAIRWPPQYDKQDLETWVVPIHPVAERALLSHLRRHPGEGDDFIFATRSKQADDQPVSGNSVNQWLNQAEEAARDAGLDVRKRKQDGWHALRRAWRSELPDYVNRKAAAKVGGWKWDGSVSWKIDPREDGVGETMDEKYLKVLPQKELRVATALPACRAGADTGPVTADSIENMDPLEAKRVLLDIVG